MSGLRYAPGPQSTPSLPSRVPAKRMQLQAAGCKESRSFRSGGVCRHLRGFASALLHKCFIPTALVVEVDHFPRREVVFAPSSRWFDHQGQPGCPPAGGRAPGCSWWRRGRAKLVPDELVGEVHEAVTDGLVAGEAHGFRAAVLAEEALAGAEDDREYDQSQLVDQVVLDQRAPELIAGRDDDFSVQLLLQLRDRGHQIALEDRRVVPVGMFEA